MESIHVISRILNIDRAKYNICWFSEDNEAWVMVFHVKWKWECCICPHCHKKTQKRKDKKDYVQKKNLKHINLSDSRIIEIKPIKRYFRCRDKDCKWLSWFLEYFEFESKHWFHTIAFENAVISSWWYMSGNKIAELSKVHPSRVYWILKKIDHTQINEVGLQILEELDEIYLWIDEHSFSRRDMILIITEIKTKRLIAVLDGITKEKLDSWIQSVPLKTQFKIKWFSTDMNKGYRKSLENILSKPVHSVDKYHLFQEANRMVDDVRQLTKWLIQMSFIQADDVVKLGKVPKRLTKKEIQEINKSAHNKDMMRKYKDRAHQRIKQEEMDPKHLKNRKWQIIPYQEITLEYFLETWYKTMFLSREKNLSPIQRLRLNQIFREFDYKWYLAQAWTLKEELMEALDERNMHEVDRIMQECQESEHHRLKQFGRTLKNWYSWIKWYCAHSTDDFKFTNAFTECTNNLCKVAKRQSHWFRLKENYIKKIFANSMISKFKDRNYFTQFA